MGGRSGGRERGGKGEVEAPRLVSTLSNGSKSNCGVNHTVQFNLIPSSCDSPSLHPLLNRKLSADDPISQVCSSVKASRSFFSNAVWT
jgi:hypothetical protein